MSAVAPKPASPASKPQAEIRVMIVDDSAAIRGFLTRWIEAEPGFAIAAVASNGRIATETVAAADPDVIVLDIEMPEMDGITALPLLLKASPHSRIIMASTLTRRNAEISLKALALGATDYVPKPTSLGPAEAGQAFKHELFAKIAAVAKPRPGRAPIAKVAYAPPRPAPAAEIKLRKPSLVAPQVVAIGSSTGGPQALVKVITALAPRLALPILITQHMPPTFTAILAETLSRSSGLRCAEGANGTRLEAGCVYVAPGDTHMILKGKGGPIELLHSPPENFCRPSVDPMFKSIAAVYGPGVLAVMLTGMGSDGKDGARAIVDAGGTVLAQDEATSVVWGMPGAVAHAGLASAVLPLDSIAGEVRKYMGLPR